MNEAFKGDGGKMLVRRSCSGINGVAKRLSVRLLNGPLINPSIKDIIPLVNVGDVLCYTAHTILIYKIEKDENGYVKEAIIIESGHGKGKSYVNSKIANKVKLPNG